MTIDDLRKNVERQFMISQVQRDEVGSKLTDHRRRSAPVLHLAPAGVRRAGQRHAARDPRSRRRPRRRAARPASTSRRTTRRRAKATAIRARILAGEDFGKVAAEVSAAPSKANGGLIGPINVERAVRRAAGSAEEDEAGRGDAADPRRQGLPDSQARDDQGSRRCSRSRACATSSPRGCTRDRQRQEVRKFLARVRGQAIIEWKNDELKKAYDQLIAETRRPGADASTRGRAHGSE